VSTDSPETGHRSLGICRAHFGNQWLDSILLKRCSPPSQPTIYTQANSISIHVVQFGITFHITNRWHFFFVLPILNTNLIHRKLNWINLKQPNLLKKHKTVSKYKISSSSWFLSSTVLQAFYTANHELVIHRLCAAYCMA